MADGPNMKERAWPLFDAIVEGAAQRDVNPWHAGGAYAPDYDTASRLLAVPLMLNAGVASGVPALALDVWVAYELRRAGIEPDWVWPRSEAPRVVSRDVLKFIEGVPAKQRTELLHRLRSGRSNGTAGASANLLGKNYTKQVDVVVSDWSTGPEVLISTKRMDSSFGNNAANRIEESYGDAKNLRLRYPQAACGFVFSLRSTAWEQSVKPGDVGIAERLVDLLAKMGMEPDAYHATALLVPEYTGPVIADSDVPELDADVVGGIEPGPTDELDEEQTAATVNVASDIANLPVVRLRQDLVPDRVGPERFFQIIVGTVLANTPVDYHRAARALLRQAAGGA